METTFSGRSVSIVVLPHIIVDRTVSDWLSSDMIGPDKTKTNSMWDLIKRGANKIS